MQRIDVPSNVPSLPTPEALGSPGYFAADGVGVQTIVTNDWANLVQEALCRSILGSGLALDKTNFNLFAQTMQAGLLNYATTTNTGNNYFVTYNIPPIFIGGEPYPGSIFRVKINATNTGVSALSINGSAIIYIKSLAGHDMYAGQLPVGMTAILQYDGTYLVLLNPPANIMAAGVYLSTDQTIPAGGLYNKVLFDTVEFDPSGIWDAANNRFISPTHGIFLLTGSMFSTPGDAGSNGIIVLYKNGVAWKRLDEVTYDSDNLTLSGAITVKADFDDYFELFYRCSTGSVIIGGADSTLNGFQCTFIGQTPFGA